MGQIFISKNILMVSHDYLPNIGGVAVYVHEMSKALSKLGHNVTILTQYRSEYFKVQESYHNGIRILRVPISRLRKLDDWQYIFRMRKLINTLQKNEEIDVIHWHTLNKDSKVMDKVRFEGIEVYTNHLSWFRMLYKQGNFKKIYSLIKNPDYIICPSREIQKMSADLFGNEKVRYLPNGVNLDEFDESKNKSLEIRKEQGIPLEDNVIVTTNRMEPIKGMIYFIDAIPEILRKHPNTTFLILGDGSLQKKLMKRVCAQHIDHSKVIFIGRVPNIEMKNWMTVADVYVQPSLMEGCSIAIIEAMACAKAIVASNIGGNPDIINHEESGLLVNPKSSIELQEAINYLLLHPQRRKELGAKAREKVENHLNWSALARQVSIIYERLQTN
ncbi:glycosyl transferase family 1 [Bacillus cereus]|uniref:glycosyltransferase family 4 protein n=1 Tax=Bacillus cereus TaxID=1396 RepID=UPI000BFA5363|nr:glycosyltransferase family 4 protein [Bacillus cereus]PEX06322.1 glycosyl transferase family 1 [Bacillus cereus]PGV18302.1 glycosyl transferase family 1 [Bacillus cereus]